MANQQGDHNADKTSQEGVVNAAMFADESTNLAPAAKQAYFKDHQILIPDSETVCNHFVTILMYAD